MSLGHMRESIMDVKQAVRTAKEHVVELFADEPIENVGLEEVEFDELNQCLGDHHRLLAVSGATAQTTMSSSGPLR